VSPDPPPVPNIASDDKVREASVPMAATVLIPARYASTRLPGKPLLAETGKPLIQHVFEAAAAARRPQRVVVATDDERIAQAVRAFGGEAVMTRPDHPTGTDRLAEAAERLGLDDRAVVVNVQGDEPELPPACVDRLVELAGTGEVPMATLATDLDPAAAADPARVKVVLDLHGRALYFSRAAIPHDRDACGEARFLLHVGVYAYRVGFLRRYAAMAPTPLEQVEKLEQLRVLEHGYSILVGRVDYHGAGIDTRADYDAFVARFRAGS